MISLTARRPSGSGLLTVFVWLVIFSVPAGAGPGKAMEKAAKAKKGAYFLKSNLPYVSGRHAFGVYKKSLVICSAEGLNTKGVGEFGVGFYSVEGRALELRINDQVKVGDIDFDDDENKLDIEIEGTGRTPKGDGVVSFVGLNGMPDFERCWNEVFSDVSIETKYEWPEAVKHDVVSRRLNNGMTREMVLVAVGNPERIDKASEGGKATETWHIQKGEGSHMGFFAMSMGDKREVSVKFVDGVVVGVESAAADQLKVK